MLRSKELKLLPLKSKYDKLLGRLLRSKELKLLLSKYKDDKLERELKPNGISVRLLEDKFRDDSSLRLLKSKNDVSNEKLPDKFRDCKEERELNSEGISPIRLLPSTGFPREIPVTRFPSTVTPCHSDTSALVSQLAL